MERPKVLEVLKRCLTRLEDDFADTSSAPLLVRVKTTADLNASVYFVGRTSSAKFKKVEGSDTFAPTMRTSSRYAVVEPNYDTHPNSDTAKQLAVDARQVLRQWIREQESGATLGVLVAIRGLLQYREVRSISVVHGFTDRLGTEHSGVPAVVLTVVAPSPI